MADSKHPHEYMKYLREERLPHIFCPGCGNGIVLNTIFKKEWNYQINHLMI